jgi:hypothetical protein
MQLRHGVGQLRVITPGKDSCWHGVTIAAGISFDKHYHRRYWRLWCGFGVALVWLSVGYELALGGFEMALVWLWCGFRVALGGFGGLPSSDLSR